jgi:hypothetical protein
MIYIYQLIAQIAAGEINKDFLSKVLDAVPFEGELRSFFQATGREIRRTLEDVPCILTGTGEWVLPLQVVDASAFIRSVINEGLLKECAGVHYINNDLVLSPALKTSIGIKQITAELLLDVLSLAVDKNLLNPQWVAKVLVCLHKLMPRHQEKPRISKLVPSQVPKKQPSLCARRSRLLSRLQEMKILPLTNGFAAFNESVPFFPIGDGLSNTIGFQSELSVLHPELLRSLDPISNAVVVEMLREIGCKDYDPHFVAIHHVLNKFTELKTMEKPACRERLRAYLQFLMRHESECATCRKDHALCNMLRKNMLIPTSEGVVLVEEGTEEECIHFSAAFGSKVCLEKQDWLPSFAKFNILDDGLLQIDDDWQSWRRFFSALGVRDFLCIRKRPRLLSVDDTNQQEDSEATDFVCPQLEYIQRQAVPAETSTESLDVGGVAYRAFKFILTSFDECWSDYRQYMYMELVEPPGRHQKRQVFNQAQASSFAVFLRTAVWIPTPRAILGGTTALACAASAFMRTQACKAIFGDVPLVPYIGTPLSKAFAKAIGVQQTVSPAKALDLLLNWTAFQPDGFETTILQMRSLYNLLWRSITVGDQEFAGLAHAEKLYNSFANKKVIFVPHSRATNAGKVVGGAFYAAGEYLQSTAPINCSMYVSILLDLLLCRFPHLSYHR